MQQPAMAEALVERVERDLSCGICLGTFNNPKILQCHHTFCEDCLKRLIPQDQHSLTCPFCSHATLMPAGGVTGLQPAFQANSLLETLKQIRAEQAEVLENNCAVHPGEKLRHFCEDCSVVLCHACVIKGAEHCDHNYTSLEGAFKGAKKEIQLEKIPIEKQLSSIKETAKNLDLQCAELSFLQKGLEAEIDVTFRQLHQVLDERKARLISRLDHITQNKLKELATQKELVQIRQAKLDSLLHFIDGNLRAGHEKASTVLAMKMELLKLEKEQEAVFIELPSSKQDMIFFSASLPKITEMCRTFGQVYSPDLADPSKCHITRKSDVAVVGESSTASFCAVNFNGKPCTKLLTSLDSELVSIAGASVKGRVERTGLSEYSISYTPVLSGAHWLVIKVAGDHIRGSPFAVKVGEDAKSHFYLGKVFGF